MTYTPSSSLIGYRAPAAGWRGVLTAHGAVPDADTILAAYDLWCKRFDLDANLLIAQACHEATYFTSDRWKDWNPAGLGVTSGDAVVKPFKTPQEGIQAHAEHICAYTYTRPSCPVDHAHMADRRHTFHEGFTDLAGLERSLHWADPGNGYVDSIVKIANSIGGGASPVSNVPWDRVHLSADVGPARALDAIKWFIVHDTEGHFAGDESVLTSAAAPIESANVLIGRQPGQCVLIVPLTQTAWAAGNDGVGGQAIQVELSKGTDETGYTEYQYSKLAEVYRYCVAVGMVNVPPVYLGLHPADTDGGSEPDDPGIIGHAGVPNPSGLSASPPWGGFGGHTDPGPDFDWPRLIGLLGNAPQPAPAPSDARVFPETGKSISGAFKGFWEQFNDDDIAMQEYGFPVTAVVPETPYRCQYFERACMEDHGNYIQLRRLGAAAAKAAGMSGPGIS